jgi:hypothetical protein
MVTIKTGFDWDNTKETYYETEAMAREVVEKAYFARLTEVPTLEGFESLETYPPGTGSACPWGRKLVWWKRVSGGLTAVKEYFDGQEEVFERDVYAIDIVGEAK